MMHAPHAPVMLNEVLAALAPRDGEIYVDGTFGAGGYSRAILEAAECRVYAIDRDPSVTQFAETLKKEFADRFVFLAGSFSEMVQLLANEGIEEVDGVVLDIGVSSMQIDQAERGFSFKKDGPLDMRMASSGISAADVVNNTEEGELADILYHYGEERQSRRIARAIVEARKEKPITRTAELAAIVHKVSGGKGKMMGVIDPATRTFQALRIHVNNELFELETALKAAEQLLRESGRLVVVSFHSLEDRITKQFFQLRCGETGGVSRHLPQTVDQRALPTFFSHQKKAASDREAAENPRARSAKLRVAIRTPHPVRLQ